MRTQSYSTLLVAALGAVDAFLLPSASSSITNSRTTTTTTTSICSYLDDIDDDDSPPTTADSDPELFRRALLAERFRLEGRSSSKKNGKARTIVAEPVDVEDFRALVETRLETEARNLADPDDVEDFRALMETRREAEAAAPEAPIIEEEEQQQAEETTPSLSAATDDAPHSDDSSSSFAKQRALLETRLALERKRAKPSTTTIADASSIASIREATRLEATARAKALRKGPEQRTVPTAQFMIVADEDDASLKAVEVFPTEETTTSEAVVVAAAEEQHSIVVPTKEPFWRKVSKEDLSSAMTKAMKPEKGVKELKESEEGLVGFAASRIIKGIVKGGEAAYKGVESIVKDDNPADAVDAIVDSAQSLVSAAAALTAIGWRQSLRAPEYAEMAMVATDKALELAEKAKVSEKAKVAAECALSYAERAKIAADIKSRELREENRQRESLLEAERLVQEAMSIAAEIEAEEERVAAERLAEEKKRVELLEEERRKEEERIAAEMKAVEEMNSKIREARARAQELIEKSKSSATSGKTEGDKERQNPAFFFGEGTD